MVLLTAFPLHYELSTTLPSQNTLLPSKMTGERKKAKDFEKSSVANTERFVTSAPSSII